MVRDNSVMAVMLLIIMCLYIECDAIDNHKHATDMKAFWGSESSQFLSEPLFSTFFSRMLEQYVFR
jgi:hypothetical protein